MDRGRRARLYGRSFLGWVGYLYGEILIQGVLMAIRKQRLYMIGSERIQLQNRGLHGTNGLIMVMFEAMPSPTRLFKLLTSPF